MQCAHCLRGCAQALDIELKHIDALMERVDSIGNLTFTGGEPSLNVQAIEYALKSAKSNCVEVSSFYIATNGISIETDFIVACLQWYAYCEEKEICQVQVSNDYWHACEESYNTELLDGLSFFGRKSSEEGDQYLSGLINEGNSLENGLGAREMEDYGFDVQDDYIEEGELYLNAHGDIVSGCNWSYESQEEYKVCRVDELTTKSLWNYEV